MYVITALWILGNGQRQYVIPGLPLSVRVRKNEKQASALKELISKIMLPCTGSTGLEFVQQCTPQFCLYYNGCLYTQTYSHEHGRAWNGCHADPLSHTDADIIWALNTVTDFSLDERIISSVLRLPSWTFENPVKWRRRITSLIPFGKFNFFANTVQQTHTQDPQTCKWPRW